MNIPEYMRYITCLLFGCALALHIYTMDRDERKLSKKRGNRQLYTPAISPYLIPTFLVLAISLQFFYQGYERPADVLLPLFLKVIIHLSIYYTVLLLLLPLLRKRISARVCAALWVLPNILYLAENKLLVPQQPLLILETSLKFTHGIIRIWFIGTLAVLFWHIIRHLTFRHKLLKNAKAIYDRRIVSIWEDVLTAANFKKPYFCLVQSPDTATPLSVGFFKKTIRVVLPCREYTDQELYLIFRHELVHIGRQDSGTKFFMVFCSSLCWFNPLMWFAVRHNAADMELSCDETVLLDQSGETRKQYAELLLHTAGDDRGFSTCLSASARTMRYRLAHTIKPRKRFLGALTAGIAMFILLCTCGLIAISYDPVTGQECIFGSEQPTIEDTLIYTDSGTQQALECINISDFQAYLSERTFLKLSGNYTYPDDTAHLSFRYAKSGYRIDGEYVSNYTVEIMLSEHMLTVIEYTGWPKIQTYYHNDEIDWAYLHSLLVPQQSPQT